MLGNRLQDEGELAIAKAQMQRREESHAAAQRARQGYLRRVMYLKLPWPVAIMRPSSSRTSQSAK